jgi:hypothetical protein
MDNSLIKKLHIKPSEKLLVINQPAGYEKRLGEPSTRLSPASTFDFIQVFVKNKNELEKLLPKVIKALQANGTLWITYPKKTASIKTDITRDHGWDAVTSLGYQHVSLVAIDETWSALRFKKIESHGSMKKMAKEGVKDQQTFTATLEKPDDGMDTAFITIPFDVEKTYGTKGQVKVKAWFDGHPYRGILANMGTDCHLLLVRKDIRQAIGKNVGDKISVKIIRDTEDRIVTVPGDLMDALVRSPKAKQFFDSLSYTNRKEYAEWITSAKKEETRSKRLSDTIQKLLTGKKNPSQKN